MKKRRRAAPHKKRHANVQPRDSSARRDAFASLRAKDMDSVLTPVEQVVRERIHRYD